MASVASVDRLYLRHCPGCRGSGLWLTTRLALPNPCRMLLSNALSSFTRCDIEFDPHQIQTASPHIWLIYPVNHNANQTVDYLSSCGRIHCGVVCRVWAQQWRRNVIRVHLVCWLHTTMEWVANNNVQQHKTISHILYPIVVFNQLGPTGSSTHTRIIYPIIVQTEMSKLAIPRTRPKLIVLCTVLWMQTNAAVWHQRIHVWQVNTKVEQVRAAQRRCVNMRRYLPPLAVGGGGGTSGDRLATSRLLHSCGILSITPATALLVSSNVFRLGVVCVNTCTYRVRTTRLHPCFGLKIGELRAQKHTQLVTIRQAKVRPLASAKQFPTVESLDWQLRILIWIDAFLTTRYWRDLI